MLRRICQADIESALDVERGLALEMSNLFILHDFDSKGLQAIRIQFQSAKVVKDL